MDYNNSSRRFRPWGLRVMAFKCDSLALRTESNEEWIFSSRINCMSEWEWLEWERKCSETVLGLDLMFVLSTACLCSLNLSLNSFYALPILVVLTRYRQNLKILTMLYHLLSHITQHFHAFLISYSNILTSYTALAVAKTSLSNRLLLLTDVALIFVTFSVVKAQLPVISRNHFLPGFFRCEHNCADLSTHY